MLLLLSYICIGPQLLLCVSLLLVLFRLSLVEAALFKCTCLAYERLPSVSGPCMNKTVYSFMHGRWLWQVLGEAFNLCSE